MDDCEARPSRAAGQGSTAPLRFGMKTIGGFFELEKHLKGSGELHADALRLSLGRAAFRLILEQLRPERVWVPFYVCKVLLETMDNLRIPYASYALNEQLEPAVPLSLKQGEYAVFINYFGLKGGLANELSRTLASQIIIDNTQAFFDGPCPGAFSFNSARKFFGVPDGSYLYSPTPLKTSLPEPTAISLLHLQKRSEGDLEGGYAAFLAYENSLTCEIRGMSHYSEEVLKQIDYAAVRERRRRNFRMYHEALGGQNLFASKLDARSAPFCYPFVPKMEIERKQLHARGIFIPTFWPEVIKSRSEGFDFERDFSRRLLPLPVDQRYGEEEIQVVIEGLAEHSSR